MSSVSPIPQSTTVSNLANLIISSNIARLSPVMTSVSQSLQGVGLPMELDIAPQGIGMPQVFVKPQHLTYLRDFRTQQCPLFANHKCSQHKPFTCFHWHFPNQRRRRPQRKLDGTFSYSPDVYCDKYDETRGECPNGDACPYLHRNAGDTERRYHLRYFKTGTCIHDTDPRGHCSRNGAHCAFAHGATDLRVPVYDIREVQEASDCPINLPASLEKERVLSEDPKWNDMGYVLANYKTEPCRKPPRMCRQGYACPFYHNAKDKRRPPQRFKYRSTPCPTVKAADEWLDSSMCEAGEDCQCCHTRTEQQFHPEIYKSTKCNDVMQQHYCPRGPFCAFAHDEAEMNFGRNFLQDVELQGLISAATAANQQHHHYQYQYHQSGESVASPRTRAHIVSPTLWDSSRSAISGTAHAIKGRTASGLSSASLESGLGSWRHSYSPSVAAAHAAAHAPTSLFASADYCFEDAAAYSGGGGDYYSDEAAAAAAGALLPDLDDLDLSQGSSSGSGGGGGGGSGGGGGGSGGGLGTGCSPLTIQTAGVSGGVYCSPQQQQQQPQLYHHQQQSSPALQTLFESDPRNRAGSSCSSDRNACRTSSRRRRPPSVSDSSAGGGGGGGGYAQSPILMSDSPFSNAGVELERLRYECEIERAQEEARRARDAAQRAARDRLAAEAELSRLCASLRDVARLAEGLGGGGGGGGGDGVGDGGGSGGGGGESCSTSELDAFRESLRSLLLMQQNQLPESSTSEQQQQQQQLEEREEPVHESGDATPSLQQQQQQQQQFAATTTATTAAAGLMPEAPLLLPPTTKFCFARDEESEQLRAEEKR